MGESAGGASILWQITAYGGTEGPAPFQQAIIQSPAWVPDIGVVQQEDLYQNSLSLLKVSSFRRPDNWIRRRSLMRMLSS